MIIDELRLLLTEAQLRAFLACYGGTDVLFEKSRDGSSFTQLQRVIGADAAMRLSRHFAGELVYISRNVADERARRDAEIRGRLAAGESAKSIARSYRAVTTLSERHVRRIAAGMTEHKRDDERTVATVEGIHRQG